MSVRLTSNVLMQSACVSVLLYEGRHSYWYAMTEYVEPINTTPARFIIQLTTTSRDKRGSDSHLDHVTTSTSSWTSGRRTSRGPQSTSGSVIRFITVHTHDIVDDCEYFL